MIPVQNKNPLHTFVEIGVKYWYGGNIAIIPLEFQQCLDHRCRKSRRTKECSGYKFTASDNNARTWWCDIRGDFEIDPEERGIL